MTHWWQRLSLRARLLVVGVLGVAAALAIGSATLYAVLTWASYRTLDDQAAATAADVATLVAQDRLPDPLPLTGSQIVQVVDGRDRVVSASANADRLAPVLLPRELDAALSGAHPVVPGSRVGLDHPVRATAQRVGRPGVRHTVVVAQQFDAIEHSQRILLTSLLVSYPLLLAVLALIAWRVIGAALRPVEQLRSAADRISGTGQDERLPVPVAADEIRALATTLNSMLDRLAAAGARQRSFVADAAHELRSPLASMNLQLEVAERLGEETPATRDLRAELARMTALVEDLLVLARLDADLPPEPAGEPVDLGALLPELVERYSGARVPVTVTSNGSLLVQGRGEEVRRVLANLVDNAVRHATSSVRVAAQPLGEQVEIVVTDDGPGVPAADRERVFERFTRLDDARDRDAGGSGLGLTITRDLVRRAGGDVTLEDAPTGGLVARVRLPAASTGPREGGSSSAAP